MRTYLLQVAVLAALPWIAVAQKEPLAMDFEAKELQLRLPPQEAVTMLRARATLEKANGKLEELADTLRILAHNFSYLRRYDEADQVFDEWVSLEEARANKDGYQVGLALTDWAQFLVRIPNIEKAEGLLRRALPIIERSAGPESRDTLDTLEGLENVYVAQGKWKEAEELRGRIAATTERKFGVNSREMALVWRQASRDLETEKRHEEALKFAQRSLEWFETAKETKTLECSRCYDQLGRCLLDMKRFAEAEGAMHKALEIAESIYGPFDIRLGPIINDLAVAIDTVATIQDDRKRRDEAEAMYRKSLSIAEKVFGSNHPQVAVSLNNVASILKQKNNHTEAEKLYRRAVGIEEAALPKNSPGRITTKLNLVEAIRELGRVKEAENICEQTLKEVDQTFGKSSATYADVLHTRGSLLARLNRPQEAEQSFWEAMKVREKALGVEHPDVARSLNNVALLVEARGDHKNPESMFRRVLSINEKHYGKEAVEIFGDLINLSDNLWQQKRLGEAEAQLKRALDVLEKTYGGEKDTLGNWLIHYAFLLQEEKKLEEAETHMRRAVAIHQKSLGDTHPQTAKSLLHLAGNLRLREKLSEAEKLARQGYIIMSTQTGSAKPSDELMGHYRDLYMIILGELHFPRNLALDRLDTMRNGADPGPLPGSST